MSRPPIEPISPGRVSLPLYDLIQLVHHSLRPGEEALAVPLIVHVFETRQATWPRAS